jgi:hypothetical protein
MDEQVKYMAEVIRSLQADMQSMHATVYSQHTPDMPAGSFY